MVGSYDQEQRYPPTETDYLLNESMPLQGVKNCFRKERIRLSQT